MYGVYRGQGVVKCIHSGVKALRTQCNDEGHKKNLLHAGEIFHDGFLNLYHPLFHWKAIAT